MPDMTTQEGQAGPARRRRLTAAQRRESILGAATEVFAAAGYNAAKMSDVAARVGVSEPVVFQNFGTKDALFAAVLDRLATGIHAELEAVAGHHSPAAALLAHILNPARDRSHQAPGSHHALFAEAAVLVADPAAGEPARRTARVIASHLADLVRSGQAEGDIRAGVDPEAAAWLLLSVLSARPLRAAAMSRPGRLEPAVTAVALAALAPTPPGPSPETSTPDGTGSAAPDQHK
jgi:AcrR family transcriptional regulator